MTGQVTDLARLGRCLACRGRIKVAADSAFVSCPLCGLTLANVPGAADLAAIAAPRAGQEACWTALTRQLDLPERDGATVLRSARLLLVPFWRHMDESRRSVSRPAVVLSGADLSPVGLPRLTRDRQRIAGLEVERNTRTGDAMGRAPADGEALSGAAVVQAALGPDGPDGPNGRAESDAGGTGAPPEPAAATWWQLVYYPVWSFHYVVYDKEHFHVVDAVSGRPVGPARRLRIGLVASSAAISLLATFLALQPWTGFAAALPAWAVSLAVTRIVLRSERRA